MNQSEGENRSVPFFAFYKRNFFYCAYCYIVIAREKETLLTNKVDDMRTIRISEEVWEAMAKIGKFGETPDDVLRKVLNIQSKSNAVEGRITTRKRTHHATNKMSSYVARNRLYVEFVTGENNSWDLPNKDDKMGIREVRDKAVEFADKQGASLGQVNAVKKALTDAGYHLIK